MRLPSFRRIFTTDFPAEFKVLIDKLSYVLNTDIQILYDALNKKISLDDNIDCQVISIDVTVASTGIPVASTIFTLTDKVRNVQGLEVIRAENQTNSAIYPTSGVFLTWQQVQTGIQIQHVTGLPISNTFRLKIVAYY